MDSESTGLKSNVLESVRYAAGTDIGMRREENQDSFGIVKTDNLRLFIVADGMGGVKGGATASSMAISIIDQMLREKKLVEGGGLVEAVSVANRMIYEKGSHDSTLNGMGTTLVALAFIDTRLFIVNVGDSRAYRIRGDRIKRLTEDHTLVMELVRSGTISLEQAGNHPVSHMLTRSLGPTPEVEIDCFESKDVPQRKDRYLLCSDGLYNLITENEMFEVLNNCSLDDGIEVLIDMANQRGGTDNITAIIIELDESYPNEAVSAAQTAASKGSAAQAYTNGPAQSAGAQEEEGSDAADLVPDQDTLHTSEENAVESADVSGFDPFAIPNFEEEKAERSEDVQREAPPADDGLSDASKKKAQGVGAAENANPVIAERVKFDKVAQEIERESAEVSAQPATGKQSKEKSQYSEAEAAQGGLTSKILIMFGVFAGFLGGGLAVVLFNSQGSKAPVTDPVSSLPSLVSELSSPGPRIAELNSEHPALIANQRTPRIELPSVADMPQGSDSALFDERTALIAVETPIGASQMNDGSPSTGKATLEHLRKRAQNLSSKASEIKSKISMFDKPLSGVYGQLLQNDNSKQDQLESRLAKTQNEVDTATRKLAIWYGRRTRLQESDLTNLATEVAVTSQEVKEKKEAFELATWEYLKEAEVLRYLPTDKLQKKKVDELGEVRSRRMHELTDAVHGAIDREIRDSESEITQLTLKREQLAEEIEALDQHIAFIKTLMSDDSGLKQQKREEFEKELAITEAELREVEQVIGDLSVQEGLEEAEIGLGLEVPSAASSSGINDN